VLLFHCFPLFPVIFRRFQSFPVVFCCHFLADSLFSAVFLSFSRRFSVVFPAGCFPLRFHTYFFLDSMSYYVMFANSSRIFWMFCMATSLMARSTFIKPLRTSEPPSMSFFSGFYEYPSYRSQPLDNFFFEPQSYQRCAPVMSVPVRHAFPTRHQQPVRQQQYRRPETQCYSQPHYSHPSYGYFNADEEEEHQDEDSVMEHDFWSHPNKKQHQQQQQQGTPASVIASLPRYRVFEPTECEACQDYIRYGGIAVQLPCEHFFHEACVVPWLTSRNSCPSCQHEVSPQSKQSRNAKKAAKRAASKAAKRSADDLERAEHAAAAVRVPISEPDTVPTPSTSPQPSARSQPKSVERASFQRPSTAPPKAPEVQPKQAQAKSEPKSSQPQTTTQSNTKSQPQATATKEIVDPMAALSTQSTWFVADCPAGDGGVQGHRVHAATSVDEDGDYIDDFIEADAVRDRMIA
jgi:hypothetical protein